MGGTIIQPGSLDSAWEIDTGAHNSEGVGK